MKWIRTHATIAMALLRFSGNVHADLPTPAAVADLGGIQGAYSALLPLVFHDWPPKEIDYSSLREQPIWIRCLETPGNRFAIGVEQAMTIAASVARVGEILDDIDHYSEIFPGFADIHVISRQGEGIETFWEQKVPVFFVPNVKYVMTYLVDHSQPGRRVYRYQLRSSKDLKYSDGMIVIESAGEAGGKSVTRYTEYDFYDANWGLATTFGADRVWRENVESMALSDLGIKVKAENPDLSNKEVRDKAKVLLKDYPLDDKIQHKQVFRYWKGKTAP